MITNYTTYIKENNSEINVIRSSYEHGNHNYVVYLNNKRCAKYSLNLGFGEDEKFVWLTNFKVYEKFRGQHLSKKILTHIVNTLKEGISFWHNEEPKKFDYIILCTNKDNDIAINLYKSFGFKEFHEDWMMPEFIYFRFTL
jgi:ribosomal protein S18 acetylase RimI-like enzyme